MKKNITVIVLLLVSFCLNAQEIRKVAITELKTIIDESNTPLVVSFWATFCVPCVEEIPYFQEIIDENKDSGVKLLLVSLDMANASPEEVAKFAKARNFNGTLFWLNETNADYFCPVIDSSWSGVIPSTLFINNKTGYRKFTEEQIKKEIFKQELDRLIRDH